MNIKTKKFKLSDENISASFMSATGRFKLRILLQYRFGLRSAMQKTRFCSSSFSVKDIQTGKKSLQNKQANFLNNLYSFKDAHN